LPENIYFCLMNQNRTRNTEKSHLTIEQVIQCNTLPESPLELRIALLQDMIRLVQLREVRYCEQEREYLMAELKKRRAILMRRLYPPLNREQSAY